MYVWWFLIYCLLVGGADEADMKHSMNNREEQAVDTAAISYSAVDTAFAPWIVEINNKKLQKLHTSYKKLALVITRLRNVEIDTFISSI